MTLEIIENSKYPYKLPVFELSNDNEYSKVVLDTITIDDQRNNVTYNNNALMFLRNKETIQNIIEDKELIENILDLTPGSTIVIPSDDPNVNPSDEPSSDNTIVLKYRIPDFIYQGSEIVKFNESLKYSVQSDINKVQVVDAGSIELDGSVELIATRGNLLNTFLDYRTYQSIKTLNPMINYYNNPTFIVFNDSTDSLSEKILVKGGTRVGDNSIVENIEVANGFYYDPAYGFNLNNGVRIENSQIGHTLFNFTPGDYNEHAGDFNNIKPIVKFQIDENFEVPNVFELDQNIKINFEGIIRSNESDEFGVLSVADNKYHTDESIKFNFQNIDESINNVIKFSHDQEANIQIINLKVENTMNGKPPEDDDSTIPEIPKQEIVEVPENEVIEDLPEIQTLDDFVTEEVQFINTDIPDIVVDQDPSDAPLTYGFKGTIHHKDIYDPSIYENEPTMERQFVLATWDERDLELMQREVVIFDDSVTEIHYETLTQEFVNVKKIIYNEGVTIISFAQGNSLASVFPNVEYVKLPNVNLTNHCANCTKLNWVDFYENAHSLYENEFANCTSLIAFNFKPVTIAPCVIQPRSLPPKAEIIRFYHDINYILEGNCCENCTEMKYMYWPLIGHDNFGNSSLFGSTPCKLQMLDPVFEFPKHFTTIPRLGDVDPDSSYVNKTIKVIIPEDIIAIQEGAFDKKFWPNLQKIICYGVVDLSGITDYEVEYHVRDLSYYNNIRKFNEKGYALNKLYFDGNLTGKNSLEEDLDQWMFSIENLFSSMDIEFLAQTGEYFPVNSLRYLNNKHIIFPKVASFDKNITEVIPNCTYELPKILTEIKNNALGNTIKTQDDLQLGLKKIGDDAFADNTSLTEMIFPTRIWDITGTGIFNNCTNLKKVKLSPFHGILPSNCIPRDESSFSTIQSWFSNNPSLEEVILPPEFADQELITWNFSELIANTGNSSCKVIQEVIISETDANGNISDEIVSSIVERSINVSYDINITVPIVNQITAEKFSRLNIRSINIPHTCNYIPPDMFNTSSSLKEFKVPVAMFKDHCTFYIEVSPEETVDCGGSLYENLLYYCYNLERLIFPYTLGFSENLYVFDFIVGNSTHEIIVNKETKFLGGLATGIEFKKTEYEDNTLIYEILMSDEHNRSRKIFDITYSRQPYSTPYEKTNWNYNTTNYKFNKCWFNSDNEKQVEAQADCLIQCSEYESHVVSPTVKTINCPGIEDIGDPDNNIKLFAHRALCKLLIDINTYGDTTYHTPSFLNGGHGMIFSQDKNYVKNLGPSNVLFFAYTEYDGYSYIYTINNITINSVGDITSDMKLFRRIVWYDDTSNMTNYNDLDCVINKIVLEKTVDKMLYSGNIEKYIGFNELEVLNQDITYDENDIQSLLNKFNTITLPLNLFIKWKNYLQGKTIRILVDNDTDCSGITEIIDFDSYNGKLSINIDSKTDMTVRGKPKLTAFKFNELTIPGNLNKPVINMENFRITDDTTTITIQDGVVGFIGMPAGIKTTPLNNFNSSYTLTEAPLLKLHNSSVYDISLLSDLLINETNYVYPEMRLYNLASLPLMVDDQNGIKTCIIPDHINEIAHSEMPRGHNNNNIIDLLVINDYVKLNNFEDINGRIKTIHYPNNKLNPTEMLFTIGGDDTEIDFINIPITVTKFTKLYNSSLKYFHFYSSLSTIDCSIDVFITNNFKSDIIPYHIPTNVSVIGNLSNEPIRLIKGSFFKVIDHVNNYTIEEGSKLYYSFDYNNNLMTIPQSVNLLLDTDHLSTISENLFSNNDNFETLVLYGDSSRQFTIEEGALEKLSTMNFIYIGQDYKTVFLHNYVSKNFAYWLDETMYHLGVGETKLTYKLIENYHNMHPDLEVITIANGIETTEDFNNNYGLGIFEKMKEVNYPPTMKHLGSRMLKNCPELVKINWPDSITTYNSWVLENCPKVTSITIPAGITRLDNLFAIDCTNVTNFCRNDGLNEYPVNEQQIQEFPKIDTLWLSHTLTKVHTLDIDPDEYVDEILIHPKIEYIYIDSNDDPDHEIITLIGIHPNYFPNLKQIKLPKKYHHLIDLTAWEGYEMEILGEDGLKPDTTVTRIEDGQYKNDETLTAIYLPDTLTYIGDNVFEGCINLKELYIPKSVTYIGKNINLNAGITKIYFADGATGLQVDSIELNSSLVELRINQNFVDVFQTKENTYDNPRFGNYLQNIDCSDEILTLPNSFFDIITATKMKLPKHLKIIPSGLLYGSSHISEFEWPEAIERIEKDGISSLYSHGDYQQFREFTFPSTLKYLGTTGFLEHVTKIYVPSNVETIQNDFKFYQNYNCKEVIFEEGSLSNCQNVILECLGLIHMSGLKKLYLPNSFNGQINFAYMGTADENNQSYIARMAHRETIKEVHLPDNVTSLFEDLSTETKKYICHMPLANCPNLEKVNIPKKLKVIPQSFLKNDPMLTVIEIPEATETIEEEAFMNCTGITQLILPNTLKTVKRGAFTGLTSVEYIVLNDWFFETDYRDVKAAFCSVDEAFMTSLKLIEIRTSESKTELNIINLAIFRELTCQNVYLLFPKHVTKIIEEEPEWNKELTPEDPDFQNFPLDYVFSNIELPPKLEYLQTDIFMMWMKEYSSHFDFPTSYRFPETLTYMSSRNGNDGFMNPNDVFEKIYIPPGITDYSHIFKGCQGLKEVYIPEGSSCDNAGNVDLFNECKSLESIVIPKSFNYFQQGAFSGCEKLKTLVCYWRQLADNGYHYGDIIDYAAWRYENYTAPIETLYIIFDQDAEIPNNAFMLKRYVDTDDGEIEELIPNTNIKTIYFIKQDPESGKLLEFDDPKIRITYDERAFANCPNLTTFTVDQTLDNDTIITKMLQTQTPPDYSTKITGTILIKSSANILNRDDTYLAFTPTVYLPGQHLLITYTDNTDPKEPSAYYNRMAAEKKTIMLEQEDISLSQDAPEGFSIKQIYFSERPDNKVINMTTFNNCIGIQIRTPASYNISTLEEIKEMFMGAELVLYREVLNNNISEYYSFASMKLKFNLSDNDIDGPCCKWSVEEDSTDKNYLIYTLRISAPKKIFKYRDSEIIADDESESSHITIFEKYREEGSLQGETNPDVELIKNKHPVLNCQVNLLELINIIPSGFIAPVVYFKNDGVINKIHSSKITDYTYNIGGINKLNCRQYISYPNSLPYNAISAYEDITTNNVENSFIGSLELMNCEFCGDEEYGCCQNGITNYAKEDSDESNFVMNPACDCPESCEMKIDGNLINNTPIYITTMLPIDEIQNGVEYESELIRGEINFVDSSNNNVLQYNKYSILKNTDGSKIINILVTANDLTYELTYPFQEISLMNHYECDYKSYTLIKKFNDINYLQEQNYYPNEKYDSDSYSYTVMQPYGVQSKSVLIYLNGLLANGITHENYPQQTKPFIPLSENTIFNIDGNALNIYKFEISSDVQTLNSETGYGYLGDIKNSAENDILNLGIIYSATASLNISGNVKNIESSPSVIIYSDVESSDEFVKEINYNTYTYDTWRQYNMQQIYYENKLIKFIREPNVNSYTSSVKYVINNCYKTEIKQSIARSTQYRDIFVANQSDDKKLVYSLPNALINYVTTDGESSEKLNYSGNVVVTENVYYDNKGKTLYTYGYNNSNETDDLKLLDIKMNRNGENNFTTDAYKDLIAGTLSQQLSNSFYTYKETCKIYKIPIEDYLTYKHNLHNYESEEIPEKTKIMFGRYTAFEHKYEEWEIYDEDGVTDLSIPLIYFPNSSNGWNVFIHEEYLDQHDVIEIDGQNYYPFYVYDRKILEEHVIKTTIFRHQLDTVNDSKLFENEGINSIKVDDYEILEIISPTFTFINGQKIIVAKHNSSYMDIVHTGKLLLTKKVLIDYMGMPAEFFKTLESNNGFYSETQFNNYEGSTIMSSTSMVILESKNKDIDEIIFNAYTRVGMSPLVNSDYYNMNYFTTTLADKFVDLIKFGQERILATKDFSRVIDSAGDNHAGTIYYPTTVNQSTTITTSTAVYPITYPGVPYRKYWSFYIPNYIDLKNLEGDSFNVISSNVLASFKTQTYNAYNQLLGTVHIDKTYVDQNSENTESENENIEHKLKLDTFFIPPGKYDSVEKLVENINSSIVKSLRNGDNPTSIDGNMSVIKDEVQLNLSCPKVLLAVDINNTTVNILAEWESFDYRTFKILLRKGQKYIFIFNDQSVICKMTEDLSLEFEIDIKKYIFNHALILKSPIGNVCQIKFDDIISSELITDKMISDLLIEDKPFVEILDKNGIYTFKFVDSIIPVRFNSEDVPEKIDYLCLIEQNQNFQQDFSLSNRLQSFESINQLENEFSDKFSSYIKSYFENENFGISFKHGIKNIWYKLGIQPLIINKDFRPYILGPNDVLKVLKSGLNIEFNKIVYYNILSSDFVETNYLSDVLTLPHVLYKRIDGKKKIFKGNQSIKEMNLFNNTWKGEHLPYLDIPERILIKTTTNEDIEYILNIGDNETIISESDNYDLKNGKMYIKIYQTIETNNMDTIYIYIDSEEHYPFVNGVNAKLKVEWIK